MRIRSLFYGAGALTVCASLVAVPGASAVKKAAKAKATTTTAAPATAAPTAAPATTAAPPAAGGSAPCGKTGGAFVDNYNFPTADAAHLDPGLNSELSGAQVENSMWDGLTRINTTTGKLQADVAESYSSNPAATVWTFKIRKGVTFSDGEVVLPSTFKKSWERNVAPDFASDYSSLAAVILGWKEMQTKASTSLTGVVADDANMTLTVKLVDPYALFPEQVTHNLYFPLPKQALAMGADWEAKGTLIGNGAFKLEKRTVDQVTKLVRNDKWFGGITGHQACLDSVEFRVSKDPLVAYNDFLAGNSSNSIIPAGKYKEAVAKFGDTYVRPVLNTSWLVLNWKSPVVGGFANTKLRQAIQASLDRDQINELVAQNANKVALGLTPPGIPGYKANLSKLVQNPKADKVLAKKLYDEWGKAAPKIEYWYRQNAGTTLAAQLIQAQIKDALGFEIELKPWVGRGYFNALNIQNPAMAAYGWIWDYAGYDNGVQLLFETADDAPGSNNATDFQVAQFDKLVQTAKATADKAKSAALFNQAETILLDTAAAIPTFWNQSQLVASSKVAKMAVSGFGFIDFAEVELK